MTSRTRAAIEGTVVFLVACIPAFFVVFNMIFSDVFGLADQALALTYAFVAYVVLGIILGLAVHSDLRVQTTIMMLPAILIVVWYASGEGSFAYPFLVLLAAALGAFLGAFAAYGFRRRRSARRTPSPT